MDPQESNMDQHNGATAETEGEGTPLAMELEPDGNPTTLLPPTLTPTPTNTLLPTTHGTAVTAGTPPQLHPLLTIPPTPPPTLTTADIDQILHQQAVLCASIEEQQQQQRPLFPLSVPQIDVIRLHDNWAGLLDRNKATTELAERYQTEPEHTKRIDWAFTLLGTQLSDRVPLKRIKMGRRHLQHHPPTTDYKLPTELSVPTDAVPDDEGATSMDTSTAATPQPPGPTTETTAAIPLQQPILMALAGAQTPPTDCAAGTDTEPIDVDAEPLGHTHAPPQQQSTIPGFIRIQRQQCQRILQRALDSEPLFPAAASTINILRLCDAQVAALMIDESQLTPTEQLWVTDDYRQLLQDARNALNSEKRKRTSTTARRRHGAIKKKRHNKSGNSQP
jgi:hypothetical protein